MSFTSIGDLASHLQLRQANSSLRTHLQRLSNEVATGRISDPARKLDGDLALLSGINHQLQMLDGYEAATTEATLATDTMQSTLGLLSSRLSGFGVSLHEGAEIGSVSAISGLALQARERLDEAVDALNTRLADRSLFSGTAFDQTALISSDEILAALESEIAGLSTTGAAVQAVRDWFGAPAGGGGYLDLAFGGSAAGQKLPLADYQTFDLSLTAADPALRDVLGGLALAALMESSAQFSLSERATITAAAGDWVLSAETELTEVAARVGIWQERIADIVISNAAERSALQMTRAGLLEIDGYDAASDLAAVEAQLEMLYVLTGRLSQMSLAGYI